MNAAPLKPLPEAENPNMSQVESQPPVEPFSQNIDSTTITFFFYKVLLASVHDVRYFAALLRGVNFVNVRFVRSFQQRAFVSPI